MRFALLVALFWVIIIELARSWRNTSTREAPRMTLYTVTVVVQLAAPNEIVAFETLRRVLERSKVILMREASVSAAQPYDNNHDERG